MMSDSEENFDENSVSFPRRPRTRSKSPKTRRNPTNRSQKLNQEQLLIALKKKKECNAKAQAIVERLIGDIEDPNEFLSLLKDINQNHFEDVIVERAIEKLCGWPLCKNQLLEVPKQQYKINAVTKKVYDITDRKNFCSGKCYKAANYLKEQMLTSPLWLRDQEDIPQFKLLNLEDKNDMK